MWYCAVKYTHLPVFFFIYLQSSIVQFIIAEILIVAVRCFCIQSFSKFWKSYKFHLQCPHLSVFASARESERKRYCYVKCDICCWSLTFAWICLSLHAASCVISAVLNIMLVYEWTPYFLSLKIDFWDLQSALMN